MAFIPEDKMNQLYKVRLSDAANVEDVINRNFEIIDQSLDEEYDDISTINLEEKGESLYGKLIYDKKTKRFVYVVPSTYSWGEERFSAGPKDQAATSFGWYYAIDEADSTKKWYYDGKLATQQPTITQTLPTADAQYLGTYYYTNAPTTEGSNYTLYVGEGSNWIWEDVGGSKKQDRIVVQSLSDVPAPAEKYNVNDIHYFVKDLQQEIVCCASEGIVYNWNEIAGSDHYMYLEQASTDVVIDPDPYEPDKYWYIVRYYTDTFQYELKYLYYPDGKDILTNWTNGLIAEKPIPDKTYNNNYWFSTDTHQLFKCISLSTNIYAWKGLNVANKKQWIINCPVATVATPSPYIPITDVASGIYYVFVYNNSQIVGGYGNYDLYLGDIDITNTSANPVTTTMIENGKEGWGKVFKIDFEDGKVIMFFSELPTNEFKIKVAQ